jgi:hypothetical protein
MSLTIVRFQGRKGKSPELPQDHWARDFLVKDLAGVESCRCIRADILYSRLMFVASWHFAASAHDDNFVFATGKRSRPPRC